MPSPTETHSFSQIAAPIKPSTQTWTPLVLLPRWNHHCTAYPWHQINAPHFEIKTYGFFLAGIRQEDIIIPWCTQRSCFRARCVSKRVAHCSKYQSQTVVQPGVSHIWLNKSYKIVWKQHNYSQKNPLWLKTKETHRSWTSLLLPKNNEGAPFLDCPHAELRQNRGTGLICGGLPDLEMPSLDLSHPYSHQIVLNTDGIWTCLFLNGLLESTLYSQTGNVLYFRFPNYSENILLILSSLCRQHFLPPRALWLPEWGSCSWPVCQAEMRPWDEYPALPGKDTSEITMRNI